MNKFRVHEGRPSIGCGRSARPLPAAVSKWTALRRTFSDTARNRIYHRAFAARSGEVNSDSPRFMPGGCFAGKDFGLCGYKERSAQGRRALVEHMRSLCARAHIQVE